MNRAHDVSIGTDEPRVALERKAKRTEARLLSALEALDRRRHRIEKLPHQILVGAIALGSGVLGLIALARLARRW